MRARRGGLTPVGLGFSIAVLLTLVGGAVAGSFYMGSTPVHPAEDADSASAPSDSPASPEADDPGLAEVEADAAGATVSVDAPAPEDAGADADIISNETADVTTTTTPPPPFLSDAGGGAGGGGGQQGGSSGSGDGDGGGGDTGGGSGDDEPDAPKPPPVDETIDDAGDLNVNDAKGAVLQATGAPNLAFQPSVPPAGTSVIGLR